MCLIVWQMCFSHTLGLQGWQRCAVGLLTLLVWTDILTAIRWIAIKFCTKHSPRSMNEKLTFWGILGKMSLSGMRAATKLCSLQRLMFPSGFRLTFPSSVFALLRF